MFALALLTGCGTGRPVIETKTIEKPVPVYVEIDESLIADCAMPALEPSPCEAVDDCPILNKDLERNIGELRASIEDCNRDKAGIRELQRQRLPEGSH